MIELKSRAEVDAMRAAGSVVAQTLAAVGAAARPGVSLLELDGLAEQTIRELGGTPSFLGYAPGFAPTAFPGSVCLSVNDVIVHGIPDHRRLDDGDLLSIDCGAIVDGWHGDAAVTVSVGTETAGDRDLSDATRRALAAGIAAARPGARLGDVSAAIGAGARAAGYGVLQGFGGHGIGRRMHEPPHVENEGKSGRGLRLRPGLVLALEPMFLGGGRDGHRILADGWAVATADGSRAAHWEHSVAVTDDGPVVLSIA